MIEKQEICDMALAFLDYAKAWFYGIMIRQRPRRGVGRAGGSRQGCTPAIMVNEAVNDGLAEGWKAALAAWLLRKGGFSK